MAQEAAATYDVAQAATVEKVFTATSAERCPRCSKGHALIGCPQVIAITFKSDGTIGQVSFR
jgi:hypothetical protein